MKLLSTIVNSAGNIAARSSSSMVARNFAEFARMHAGDITGVKLSMSLRDNNGMWHTCTQRLFKNGSIHSTIK